MNIGGGLHLKPSRGMMSKVKDLDPLEHLIHQAFHDIADKYGIDVDLVAEIIKEYDQIMSENLEGKAIITEN